MKLPPKLPAAAPMLVALAAIATVAFWFLRDPGLPLALRVPGTDAAPGAAAGANTNAVLLGRLVPGLGTAAALPGAWPQFRGPQRDGIAAPARLARTWPAGGPRELWATEVGDGYAGPAVSDGRVFLMDYDVTNRLDALRCLSLGDGREIWRYTYPVSVKRNHGMSRTVPALASNLVVALGPKGHVLACDAATGALHWTLDLVRDFGATVPEWYCSQCPLIEGDRVFLAPGGPDALLLAVELATGKPLWRTPNTNGWKMTHSSITPLDLDGRHLLIYCGNKGIVAVDAADGALLWESTEWKISIATVPSPCVLENGKVFFTGGYNAGSMLFQFKFDAGKLTAQRLLKLDASVFGATQHTPVFQGGHLYGPRADGRFVCLTPAGKVAWASGATEQFGLGSFLLADGLILAVNDSGLLRLLEATPGRCNLLGQAQVLKGRESWGPMALVGNRLLVRDLTRLACLDLGAP